MSKQRKNARRKRRTLTSVAPLQNDGLPVQATPATSSSGIQNPVLAAAEQKIESQLLPQVHDDYMKIVVSGMRVALAKGPDGLAAKLKRSPNPVLSCATGAIDLVMLMSKNSQGVMPMKAMIPAAATLMFHALDFAEKAGLVKIGPNELAEATHAFTNYLFKILKITPQMLHNAATQVHGVMNDPTQMELINRKAGVVKTPGTSEPTPLPNAPEASNGV